MMPFRKRWARFWKKSAAGISHAYIFSLLTKSKYLGKVQMKKMTTMTNKTSSSTVLQCPIVAELLLLVLCWLEIIVWMAFFLAFMALKTRVIMYFQTCQSDLRKRGSFGRRARLSLPLSNNNFRAAIISFWCERLRELKDILARAHKRHRAARQRCGSHKKMA